VFKDEIEPLLETALEERVPVVSFFWGDPAPFVERVHSAGAIVMHTIGSASEAKRSIDQGTDVVVAQVWEAGGHVWGMVSTLALVPAVAAIAGATPVVAAGAIADGSAVVAPHRVLRNATFEAWQDAGQPRPGRATRRRESCRWLGDRALRGAHAA